MRSTGPHHHPCAICQTPVVCDGELLQNYDGEPAVICSERHHDGGIVVESYCPECAAAEAQSDDEADQ